MKSILVSLVAVFLAFAPPAFAKDGESGMDRVIRTNTIRCGYYVYPPVVIRDPNTGELSGLSVDMMNAIGKAAGLKVEWTEEVNFANWAEALQSKRFDVACTPMWPDIPLARVVAFTVPFMYAGLSPIVRADDDRFKDDNLERLNSDDIKFIAQDGNSLATLTRDVFDKAQLMTLSSTMDGPSVMQEIYTKKADAILGDRNNIREYNSTNPIKLRLVAPDKPVKVQSFNLAVTRDDLVLKGFLDNAIAQMLNDGTLDRMIAKWELEPNLFLRVSKPYAVAE